MSQQTATAQNSAGVIRAVLIPAAVAAVALAVAVIGALIARGAAADSGIDVVNLFVETLSGGITTRLNELPLVFALGAGVAAAFNPCGFAMLPAYLGLYLGANEPQSPSIVSQIGKALLIGATVSAGFVLLFALAGAVIALGARSALGSVLPWIGITIGILLTLVAAWLVSGGKLYTALAQQLSEKFGNPGQTNIRGYFIFGLSYGLASLSCTLPIFLAVIGTSFASASIWTSFAQFVLYALGMGAVILALTLGIALFKTAMVGMMRKAMPIIAPLGNWLMLVAGAYIVFYWLTIGDILG